MQQLGFDMMFHDAVTQEVVPWAVYSPDLVTAISNAPWKIDDIETTGLNIASKELSVSGREYRRGVDPTLRLRILSITFPHPVGNMMTVSFDFDKLSTQQQETLSNAALNNVVLGHNVGFDVYWLRLYGKRKVKPTMILDSMLIARILRPDLPLVLAKMCNNPELPLEISKAAEDVFMQGRSGFSLADCQLALFHVLMSKKYQKPSNWAEPFLTQEHYDYASGDTRELLRMMNVLLGLPKDTEQSWLDAYMKKREEVPALKIVEPQVMDVIQMREKGMPWKIHKALAYVEKQKEKVRDLVNKLCEMQPSLKPYQHELASIDAGINAALKQAAGEVFSSLGLELEVTEKKGEFKIGEKDLRRVRAELNPQAKPFFDTWVAIMRAKKAAGMAREVSGFAKRSGDERLHPNTGHGPITGRLSSSEPNCFLDGTEILTETGWKHFSELTPQSKVAEVDSAGNIFFVVPNAIINQKFTGMAKRLQDINSSFSVLLTPHHGLLWYDKHKDSSIRLEAAYTPDSDAILLQDVNGLSKTEQQPTELPEHIIEQISSRAILGTPVNDAVVNQYFEEHNTLVPAHNHLQPSMVRIIREQAFALLDRKEGICVQNVKQASRLQEWLVLAGIATYVECKGSNWHIHEAQFMPAANLVHQSEYASGTAWCVSVPSGRILVRTNGHVWVSGNCQQFPRDQGFRDCVEAAEGFRIVASDYSALDMRVGAALALRAQRQIFEVYMGARAAPDDLVYCIEAVYEGKLTLEMAREAEKTAFARFEAHMKRRDEVDASGTKTFWEQYRKLSRNLLLARFSRCYAEVRMHANEEGTAEWGSLRDAFSIDGMDIHTWTALSMRGQDPKALFSSLPPDEVGPALKKHKKELGDARQTGKVGNLSLLYAMKTKGLMDAAAKNYNIHWTYEEADKVRKDWLAAYVEIDLWHIWTDLNAIDKVYIPDKDTKKYAHKQVFLSETLGGRKIYAFSNNAALSYEDQSTGADILGRVMETFRLEHDDIYQCIVNQVHDEIVFEVPEEVVEEMTDRIGRVMRDCSEFYLMQYGVKGECSPAVGQVWLKD